MGGAETSALMGTVHTCSEAQAVHEHLKRNLDICYAYLHKDLSKFVVAAAPAATADSGADPAEEKKEEPAKESD
ncbi:hypothetical protein ACET3Z_009178 [Daucus carota]